MDHPAWIDEALDAACDACAYDRTSPMSSWWSAPDKNSYGCWLLMVAPCVIEFEGGKDDPDACKEGYDFVNANLLDLMECFDEVEDFNYDANSHNMRPGLTLSGTIEGEEVVLEVYFSPEPDDKPTWIVNLDEMSFGAK